MPVGSVVFLASVAALTSVGIDMSLPGIPRIETDLGARAGQGALCAISFAGGFAVMPLVGGPLSDCFGRSRVLIASLISLVLASVGCALAHSMALLLFFRVMQGCASGIATTLPLAIVGDTLAGNRARQGMSEISTLSGIMPIVAPALGHWAIALGGWRLLFGLQAAFTAVLAVSALFFRDSLAARSWQRLSLRGVLRDYRTLIAEPTLRSSACVFGLLFACTFCFTAISPLALILQWGMPRSTFAFVMMMNAVGSLLGAATSALLSRHQVSARRIILAGLMLATGSTSLSAVLEWSRCAPAWIWLVQVFLAFFGFNLAGPSLLLHALEHVPGMHGSGSGLMRSIFMLINSAAGWLLCAFCVQHLPYTARATTLLMAILATSATLLYSSEPQRRVARVNA